MQGAKSFQLCLTLCEPLDCSPPGASFHGILQARYCSESPCPPPGIFQTQGLNPNILCLLHWQAGSLPLAPPGKPSWFRRIIFHFFFSEMGSIISILKDYLFHLILSLLIPQIVSSSHHIFGPAVKSNQPTVLQPGSLPLLPSQVLASVSQSTESQLQRTL